MAILSGDSLTDYENGITVTQSPKPNNAHQKMPTKKYWPCAPDGFIPNSVIRALIVPKKSVLVKQEPWKLKPIKFVEEKIEISFYEQGWWKIKIQALLRLQPCSVKVFGT